MKFEPLSGRREVRVTESRTRRDFAHCLRDLAGTHYPQAEKIVLVMDNLNTQHGSWLNMAEIELNVINSHGLSGRGYRT
jgi:hypothetical protein